MDRLIIEEELNVPYVVTSSVLQKASLTVLNHVMIMQKVIPSVHAKSDDVHVCGINAYTGILGGNFFYKNSFHVEMDLKKVRKQGRKENARRLPSMERWQKRKTRRLP